MRQDLGIAEDTFVLGHIGRFTVPKNHQFLMELFAEYHEENPNSKLLLVGDGELFETVQQQCTQLGISDSVIMVGSKTNTEDYYQVMDVFVFPSLWEGLPVSVVEAQANGLHCLLSDVITHDVDLTDQVKYLALANKKVWLCEVANLQRKHRIAATAENMAMQQWLQSNFKVFIWNRMKGQENESIYIAPRRCLRLYGCKKVAADGGTFRPVWN